jgi:hypothetical protein
MCDETFMRDPDDEACLRLGRMLVGMINDLALSAGADKGYGVRKLMFANGQVYLIVANDLDLVELMEGAAAAVFDIKHVTPRSQSN